MVQPGADASEMESDRRPGRVSSHVPQTQPTERMDLTVPPAGLDEDGPALPEVPVRNADGGLSNFDEIVTPAPVAHFLFRRRTLIVLLGILAIVPFAHPKPIMLAVGIALAVVAECWRIWAAGTIHKTEELTTGGPYAHVRHPLYVGSFVHAVAYCFMSGRMR